MPEDRDELSVDELAAASGGNTALVAEPTNTNACASGANCHCTGGT
jgi:hypothetical protein